MIHNLANIFNTISSFFQIPAAHAADAATANPSVTTLFGLNWKLFIAQLINFGIILFVLWKWVFGPLGKKLEERSDKIEKSLKQAEEIEEKHRQAEQARLAEIEKAYKEAGSIIEAAQKTANQTKDQIIAEAKQASERLQAQTKQQLQDEKAKLLQEVRQEAANMVVAATEKIIRQKLDPKKDEQLIKESLKDI